MSVLRRTWEVPHWSVRRPYQLLCPNHLQANPDKTQISTFHLKNHDANCKLTVHCYGKSLAYSAKPIYLGVTLDCNLSYKDHVIKTKTKIGARNNILRKLASCKWGPGPETIWSTALALCYSAAEYACSVWGHSSHTKKLDPVLNAACRTMSGCPKPTRVDDLYLLCDIAPSPIRRAVSSKVECTKRKDVPRPGT